jgi:hypothetical protein
MTSLDIKMNAPRKRLRTIIRIVMRIAGVLLVMVSLFVSYWWFYKLAPWRCTLDPYWRTAHSEQEYWREVQKGIHRGMWQHDDGFAVGRYGDKSWARWIMNHVEPGMDMGCMGTGPCHSDYAMQHITNQDVGENSDEWLRWWETNGAKSQEEWILDGFAQYGVVIDIPPTAEQTKARFVQHDVVADLQLPAEQIEALLALIGDSETDETKAIPVHVKYNAFRWLRDSGFDPVAFVVSNRTISEQAVEGVLKYSKHQRRWPKANEVGILPFGKVVWEYSSPRLMEPDFQAAAYTLSFLPLGIGTGLIVWSFRKKRKAT